MKKFFVLLLYVTIAVQIIIPVFTLATVGYDSAAAFVFDIYKNLLPAILAGGVIYLLKKDN